MPQMNWDASLCLNDSLQYEWNFENTEIITSELIFGHVLRYVMSHVHSLYVCA